MTGPEADAFFIEYNCDASGRQGKTHWFCLPPEPEVPDVITHEERNEGHTVRRIYGWTTKLLRD
jgi:hypothetical protein